MILSQAEFRLEKTRILKLVSQPTNQLSIFLSWHNMRWSSFSLPRQYPSQLKKKKKHKIDTVFEKVLLSETRL